MKALSIRQPWAWLIVNGFKDIENRSWSTNFRGEFLVHASLKLDYQMANLLQGWAMGIVGPDSFLAPIGREFLIDLARKYLAQSDLQLGGIVGKTELIACVKESISPWFQGKNGFVLRNSAPTEFIPCKGKLGFFDVDDRLLKGHIHVG